MYKFITILIMFISVNCFGQFYSDFEAKWALINKGSAMIGDFIENAETITVKQGQIKGSGGICISLPILRFVYENKIILLNGASGVKANNGTIILTADLLYISAVYYDGYLIVGQSVKDCVNYLCGY